MLDKNILLDNKTILITGVAGFIGANLAMKLLSMENWNNIRIIGLDNMNGYYDVSLKEYRLRKIWDTATDGHGNTFFFKKGDIARIAVFISVILFLLR